MCVKTEYCKVSGDYENLNLKRSMLERGISCPFKATRSLLTIMSFYRKGEFFRAPGVNDHIGALI